MRQLRPLRGQRRAAPVRPLSAFGSGINGDRAQSGNLKALLCGVASIEREMEEHWTGILRDSQMQRVCGVVGFEEALSRFTARVCR